MLSDVEELPSVQLGDYVLRFELEDLTPFGKEVAKNELRETPEIRAAAIEELRTLLKDVEDLVVPLDNDDWMIRFLRPCKFYAKSACELIQRYYQFKVNRDQLGRRVLLLELGKTWKHKEVSLDEVFKGCVLFLEAAMLEPETQVHGAVVIFDMDGLTLQQAWQFTPPFAKRIVDWLQDAVPLRIKGIHIINQPKIFNMVFALFKPILREKLRNRIIFHGTDRESLYKHISKECLPAVYGGTVDAPRVQGEQWYELLLKCDNEYKEINNYGYIKQLEEQRNKKNKKK
ncbi:clavesin-1 isoform X2 [Anopheles arabiensis]|nr:clavesin-1 isoform X2 [Anopheles arabiensis]XP_040165973.1 clavesin-1 isoform X2 [Anopheles arabiensis]XP_040165974.1 clavesin-1 isoform X2 [Anopheles arabiensis]